MVVSDWGMWGGKFDCGKGLNLKAESCTILECNAYYQSDFGVESMHEMNVLVTVFVLAALYIAVFYVVEKVFLQDKT